MSVNPTHRGLEDDHGIYIIYIIYYEQRRGYALSRVRNKSGMHVCKGAG